jgi:GNAT superfamily N-acetyltransferase
MRQQSFFYFFIFYTFLILNMSLTASAIEDRRISRRITVNLNQHTVNVRPVIKGAFEEAACSLTEAYLKNSIMEWCIRGLDRKKHEQFLHTLFKNMINQASLLSRDFAIQVDGCKGILTWTNSPNGFSWPRILGTAKLARLIGWTSALRAVTKVAPSCDKMKRKILANYPQYITIGYVGVLPHEQHKGYGAALVQYVLDKADDAKHPVYVEASDPASVRFFESFGFSVQTTVFIANHQELPVALMVREPIVSGSPERLSIRPGRRTSGNSL